jgi:hypothetical protein
MLLRDDELARMNGDQDWQWVGVEGSVNDMAQNAFDEWHEERIINGNDQGLAALDGATVCFKTRKKIRDCSPLARWKRAAQQSVIKDGYHYSVIATADTPGLMDNTKPFIFPSYILPFKGSL